LSVYSVAAIPDTDEHSLVAGQFKKAFEDARDNNVKLTNTAAEDRLEETLESNDENEGEANAPSSGETNSPVEGENAEEE
jgi:hypothetical protein